MVFTAPKSGIYTFNYSLGSEVYDEFKIEFCIYKRIEVGKVRNNDKKWFQFWKEKYIPVYEYEKVDIVEDYCNLCMEENYVVFIQNKEDN